MIVGLYIEFLLMKKDSNWSQLGIGFKLNSLHLDWFLNYITCVFIY